MEEIINRLLQEIRLKGLSKSQIAQRCDLSYPAVMNFFSGRINPSLKQVYSVAKAVDLEIGIIEKENYIKITKLGDEIKIYKIENGVSTQIKIIDTEQVERLDLYKYIIENITPFLVSGVEVRVKL